MQPVNSPANEAKLTTGPLAGGALMDGKATAAFLGLSEWTLAAWRCSGDGPRYSKLGNRIRYSTTALNQWIESKTVGSTSEKAV